MKTTENNFELIYPSDLLKKYTNSIFKELDNAFEEILPFKRNHPSANIVRTDTGVSLEMAIPGYGKEDVEVSIEKNVLTVSCKKEDSKQNFSRKEFSYNSFSRSFTLSEELDVNSIKSSMNNGILTILINKLNPETVKTEKKKIPVE